MIFTSRRWFTVFFGAALALTPMVVLACPPEQAELTAEEQLALATANNQIALDMFDPAWNEGDLSVVDRLIAPNALDHSPLATEEGSEGFKRIIGAFRAAMPDLHMSVEDEIYLGDRVVHRWRVEGTHTGAPLFGVAPSGNTIVLTGITIVRIEDGLIQERWTQLDQLGLQQQLGLLPRPGGN